MAGKLLLLLILCALLTRGPLQWTNWGALSQVNDNGLLWCLLLCIPQYILHNVRRLRLNRRWSIGPLTAMWLMQAVLISISVALNQKCAADTSPAVWDHTVLQIQWVRLRFSEFLADIVCFINLFILLNLLPPDTGKPIPALYTGEGPDLHILLL